MSYAVVLLNICRQLRPRAAGTLFLWLLGCARFAAAEAASLEGKLRGWVWGGEEAGAQREEGGVGAWQAGASGVSSSPGLGHDPISPVGLTSGEWQASCWSAHAAKDLSALSPHSV